jgi:hypothetical protein
MPNDVFEIARDLSIRYFNSTLGAYVEIVADSFEVEIDRGIDVENGVFAEGAIGTATVKLVKKNLTDFLGTPGYKSGDQFDIRYRPNPDTLPFVYNIIYGGWIQNVSMTYINESQTLEITITANDAMKVFQNTLIPSFSVTGTVVNRSFRNCMINLTAAINAATTYPGGVSLTALGAGASGTTQRAFTWTNTPAGEIASKFMDAELGWYFTGNGGGVQYLTRTDINTLQAVTFNPASPTVSNVHFTNLLTNGTFEVNTTGWSPGTSVTLTRDTAQFYAGVASMRVNSTATTSTAYTFQTNTTMTAVAKSKYKASIWVKAQANTPTARVQIAYVNSGGTTLQLDSSAFIAVNTSGWTELAITSVAPVGTSRVELRVQANKTSAAIGSLWADVAKIENLTTISANHFCLDNINLQYDSDILVNKCVVIDGTAGTRTVATNSASVTASGEQSGTFTVDFDPAGASTYAQWATEVANAATIKQVYGVTVPPVRDDGVIGNIANWGVGTTLQVEFAQDPLPALQVVSIVSRINHIITPQHWEMNIGLWRGM